MVFNNPVIRGFYPDPSVCRVGSKYYLVSSSFQYFPGVPLFESDDLINWTQIGYCLTRKSQLPLDMVESSGGIFAPTIRYYDGRFYMTTTNEKNFYVWTDNIYGEWSEPIFVEQGGIDPSLYFEDSKAYFMSNGIDDSGRAAVFQCEIDIETGEKLSESKAIWYGTGGRYLESPHLYKINGYYYLMVAEGGTEYGHMVTYARAGHIFGPFTPYEKNPVLTNRNLGGYPIQGIGHADLVDDVNGNWWIFHLGFRQIGRWLTYHHLGREVFLMPVNFKSDGWFIVGENGTTTSTVETEKISSDVLQKSKTTYSFDNTEWDKDWRFLRSFDKENYLFDKNSLKIRSIPVTIDMADSPAFIGLHQKEFDMELSVQIKVLDGEAGVTLYMDENHHYDFSIIKENDNYYAMLKLNIGDIKFTKNYIPISSDEIKLKIISNANNYEFNYYYAGEKINLGTAQTKYISTEVAGGFTGVVIGLYSQNGLYQGFNEFSEFSCVYK